MKYVFVLGNHPELSLAEIYAYFGQKVSIERLTSSIAMVEGVEFEALDLIKKLGGTIKIAKIEAELDNKDLANFAKKADKWLVRDGGKVVFGFSNYGASVKVADLAMNLKKFLRDKGESARWVISREAQLSSVVVGQNKLIGSGAEFILVPQGKSTIVTRTLAVQDYKGLSHRDYGRPGRDDQSGMLPPKLAQILINLSGAKPGNNLLDPFCGSGTILTEAALMDINDLIGSDISAKAVADTKNNLEWFQKKFNIKAQAKVRVLDARRLGLAQNSIDACALEGYLGPQRGKVNWPEVFRELKDLYNQFLAQLHAGLKPGARVAMALPYVRQGGKPLAVEIKTAGWKRPEILPIEVDKKNLSERGYLLYGRSGQKVWREIIILQK